MYYGRMIIGKVKDCPIKGFVSVQINNLKIKWSKMNGMYVVYSPRGIALEEFTKLTDAKQWAKETKDYVRKR